MSKLHIFGDSYSTPNYLVQPNESWWGLLSHDLDVTDIVNWSWWGSNLDNIAHTMFCYQDQILSNDYVVIAVPPLIRVTVFEPDTADELPVKPSVITYNSTLSQTKSELILSHSGLIGKSVTDMGKSYVQGWNPGYAEAIAIRTIGLLLGNFNVKIIVVNASMPFQEPTMWPTLGMAQAQLQNDSRVELQNTYYSVNLNKYIPVDYDKWGWNGHHGPDGNLEFYTQVVKPLAQGQKWL